ncbi:pilus assembly protein TadG-related protein [Defluviimonas aestuarii]|uniref:pilus assembly protein TadG-related protein n=1 Tax=Albidovulum aestuarii TaxID=1130726 RepID=UPI00249B3D92|nr:pilus assembly protein TadG-related protein [Defluviimonas aestuarii]MDI3336311.1 pilus assembly protein TadG-related protein [Defluviimonas aestuarii]
MFNFKPIMFGRKATTFAEDETGGITALSLQMFLATLVIGGLAVDFGSGVATKTQLQVAADAAAHAAVYTREYHTPDEAKTKALEVAAANMPAGKYGNILTAADIQFGDWDRDKQVFIANPKSRNAVLVAAKRHKNRGNGVGTYMLGLVGYNQLDVTSGTVFETYYPMCFREGFVAQERVEVQSGSHYGAGFCIHSQSYVKASSNNQFDPGTVVSMPSKSDVELPSSGFATNTGLEAALRDGSYKIRILNRINDIYTGLMDPKHATFGVMTQTMPNGDPNEYYRSYIKKFQVINLNYKMDAEAGTFTQNRIHEVRCKQDKWTYDLKPGTVLKNAVLITDCRLTIHAGAQIEDAVIFVDSTESTAVRAPSSIVIGKDDKCADGGDVQIVTRGSVSFASGVSMYGSQIIALGDISLTANANGLEGVSLVAGGKLDVTSNGAYGFCGGNGMSNNYEAAYFRLAK